MDILVGALLAWIGANSRFETAGIAPPDVVMLAPEALTAEYYSGVPHLLPEDGVDERLNALYAATDGAVGTIYILHPDVTPDAEHFDDTTENPLWREMLLHELVHHVQWRTGEADTWSCAAAGEREAYHLGGLYLRQVNATDPLPNRNFWAHMYSRC
jgi:hypothetical protein